MTSTTKHIATNNNFPYRVDIEGRTYRARTLRSAKASVGRHIAPGKTALITYWGTPVLQAIGTGLGWREA